MTPSISENIGVELENFYDIAIRNMVLTIARIPHTIEAATNYSLCYNMIWFIMSGMDGML